MNLINKREWRWTGLAACLLVFLARLPYLVGYLVQTEQLRFAGVTVAPVDNLSYLAKMQQGFAGNWTLQLPYTAQPHEGTPIHLFYLFLGHAARWTGLSIPLMFHLAAVLCGLLFLLMVYYFISHITPAIDERRYLFALVGFSSGFGWLMVAFGELLSTDLTVPESNTFFTLMACPHFAFSQMMMLVIFLSYVVMPHAWKLRTFISSVAVLGLTIIHPFMLFVVYGALGLYSLALWKQDHRPPVKVIAQASVSLLVIIPFLIMMYRANYSNPAIRTFQEQAIMASPPIPYFLSGYGVILPVAAVGVVQAICHRTRIGLLLVCWVVVAAVGLYLPFSFQRRLSEGLHLPLAILSGIAISHLLVHRWPAAKARKWARGYLLATYPTSVVLIVLFTGGAALHSSQLFISRDEEMALDWIGERSGRPSVVLSSTELGSFIPAQASVRAVSGHDFETLNADEVKADVKRFYASETPTELRQAMLCQWRVDYVVVGPREQALGIDTLVMDDYVSIRRSFGDVEVFQIDLANILCT